MTDRRKLEKLLDVRICGGWRRIPQENAYVHVGREEFHKKLYLGYGYPLGREWIQPSLLLTGVEEPVAKDLAIQSQASGTEEYSYSIAGIH